MPDIGTVKSSMIFYTKAGQVCTAKQFADSFTTNYKVVGCSTFIVAKDSISIFARYAGIDHGNGCFWEIGIDGNSKNAEHEHYHGLHEVFKTEAETLARYTELEAELKSIEDK